MPAAELRPIDSAAPPQTLDERLVEWTVRGVLLPPQPSTRSALAYPVGAKKPGALRREQREVTTAFHAELSLIAPDRALSEEIARVLEAGSVRGADC